jgi:hypothetical protein
MIATGQFTLTTKGREITLHRPEMIPASQALPAYPRWVRQSYKTRGIEHYFWAHRTA